ncbi:reverse transcriptase domain-containing protein [Chitinophaga sp. LS1]|uniref:reverse transcriptase domain-containing protein n=1 Tax=Chitinophaga sp. LS1 TaxID=3051176 RepID=UPI002AAA6A9C|nr:reverse transcriptase domain-containing protein [Chitinophaga sp. LS1]WPV67029.1 reverse transcriptase domain-containing protein [Chitinophaga sp. LS1]WPV67098.1 reverse transcriptase domain-containing protein [Chitinophaga sp. LS1]
MMASRSLPITKEMVWHAYGKVKRSNGSAGVDEETISMFDQNLSGNLYKLWNRLRSGSYFPPAVKEVAIPKGDGKVRKLGIPTVSDRIAQMVVKDYLEPIIEPIFHPNSFGYRPGKNALQAVEQARRNCWDLDWAVDLDIQSFFDDIDHELLLKAIERHTSEKWVLLYIRRWLTAPIHKEQQSEARTKGTPQGGVSALRSVYK